LIISILWKIPNLFPNDCLPVSESFFCVAKPSQNQPSPGRNSDSDRCGILFYASSGTVVKIPKSVALASL
jgi:hypothetical protein